MTYYTYIYRDPSRNNEPIYVGKGTKRRAWHHLTRTDVHPLVHRLSKMKKLGITPDIEIIPAIDESHAYFMEECCIAVIGRKNLGNGPLLNLTDGGGGPSGGGWKLSQTAKDNIGRAATGRKMPPTAIEKIRQAHIGKPFQLTPEALERRKVSITKTLQDPKWRAEQSARITEIWRKRKEGK